MPSPRSQFTIRWLGMVALVLALTFKFLPQGLVIFVFFILPVLVLLAIVPPVVAWLIRERRS